ncbi:MAG: sensor histidine kinase [Acidobacteriota bacterium]
MARALIFSRSNRTGDLSFFLVVVATYLSAIFLFGYSMPLPSWFRLIVLLVASMGFLIIGIYGFARCRRTGSLFGAGTYFSIQIVLATTTLYLSKIPVIAIIMLPLASQSVVVLPRRLMMFVCGILVLVVIMPVLWHSGPSPALVIGSVYLVFVIFVAAFTNIAVSEQKARAEIESLAAQLGKANHQLREYAVQVEELATAKERNRLAREIHDSIGHYLTVINVQLEMAQIVMERDRLRAMDALQKAQSLTKDALADVRRSVTALRAAPMESRSLLEVIKELADECRTTGIYVDVAVTGAPRPLLPQVELTLYRTVQEGLTNVQKHAGASTIYLKLIYGQSKVQLIIEDDGVGISESNIGFGLLGLRERAQLLGGTVQTGKGEQKGFILEMEIPI